MSEQPAEIADNNEVTQNLPLNNNDTQTARQLREQAASELGLSYDDSIAMPLSELKQKIAEKNDPHFAIKQQLLEANNKIAEMQNEPETEVDAPTLVIDDAQTEILPSIANAEVEPEKFSLYTKAGAFTQKVIDNLHEKWSGQSGQTRASLAVSAIGAYLALRITGLSHTPNASGSPLDDQLDRITATAAKAQTHGITDAVGATGQTGATSEVTNGTGGAQAPNLPLYGEIDTQSHKPHSTEFAQHYADNHKGNKVNSFGGTERGIVEKADYGTLHGDYLDRYTDTHDRMTAHNVEKLVNVRFQEMHGLDADFFNSPKGQHMREVMKHEYLSDSGHTLSEKGQHAQKLHMEEIQNGRVVKVTAQEAINKYGLSVNSFIDEGDLKGGIDDKAIAQGAIHDAVYLLLDKNDKVIHAEIGNCGNEIFKGNITTTPSIPGTPGTPGTPDEDIKLGLDGDFKPHHWPTTDKPPTTDTPGLTPKDPTKDSNLSHGDTDGTLFPTGEQKPATDPPTSYTPPAAPEAPTTPRPETPPTPDTGTGNGTGSTGPAH
jgi:hypothetical protein